MTTKQPKQRDAVFQPEFIEDLRYWVETDRKIALRAFDLIQAILHDPFDGIGKPEPLKGRKAYSRRIDDSNRLVYIGDEHQNLEIISCKGHYDD